MDELKFVLKAFLFAIVLTILLQLKVGHETLEVKSDRLMRNSTLIETINLAAQGAVDLASKAQRKATDVYRGSFGQSRTPRTPAAQESTARAGSADHEIIE